MTDLNLSSIFESLVRLVFPAISIASLFLYVQKKKYCIDPRSTESSWFKVDQ